MAMLLNAPGVKRQHEQGLSKYQNLQAYLQHCNAQVHIAERHLIPKLLEEHGLTDQQLQFPRAAVLAIAHGYTREAGVRSLSRCCRREAAFLAVHCRTQLARCVCRLCLGVCWF